jgi:hypothetical protein
MPKKVQRVRETLLGKPARVIKTATGAGNTVVSISPGTGKRWTITHGYAKMVCDATVANRQLNLKTDDGTTENFDFGINTTAITASQTKVVSISNRGASKTITETNVIGEWAIPVPFILEGADRLLLTAAVNGVAGDVQSLRVTVLEENIVA